MTTVTEQPLVDASPPEAQEAEARPPLVSGPSIP